MGCLMIQSTDMSTNNDNKKETKVNARKKKKITETIDNYSSTNILYATEQENNFLQLQKLHKYVLNK